MSIAHLNNGDSGSTARSIINDLVDGVNSFGSLTLAQVLANGNLTGGLSITSDDTFSQLSLINGDASFGYTDGTNNAFVDFSPAAFSLIATDSSTFVGTISALSGALNVRYGFGSQLSSLDFDPLSSRLRWTDGTIVSEVNLFPSYLYLQHSTKIFLESPVIGISAAVPAQSILYLNTFSNIAQLNIGSGLSLNTTTGTLSATGGSGTVTSVTSANANATVATTTTTPVITIVAAPKWATARNLAGNSVDGTANVAFSNKFIVQGTTDAGLSGAQFLGALGTGIVKNTTTTGILSIAIAADFPTLNQNTTGSAATLTTPRNIQGVAFDGSAAINPINGTGFVKVTGTTLSYDNSTYITGNQSITLSGDVSGSGTTAITVAIGAGKVTNTMLAGSIDLTAKVTGVLPSANGGTGVNNAGTFTNASNTTITGGGTIALGGFTLTVPATGTATLGSPGGANQVFVGTSSTTGAGNSSLLYSTSSLSSTLSSNAATSIQAINANAGTGAQAQFIASNGTVTNIQSVLGTGFATSGLNVAGLAKIATTSTVGMLYQNTTAGTKFWWTNGGSATTDESMRLLKGGLSIGTQADPTAVLHLKAGTATASTAPLKFNSGTNLTTGEAGAMEYNGTNLFFTRTGTTREGVLVGNRGASAPSTSVLTAFTNYYGTGGTIALSAPNTWFSVVGDDGNVYKIPAYS